MNPKILSSVLASTALVVALPVHARTEFTPEVSVRQVFDFAGRGDAGGTDIWTEIVGGFTGAVDSRKVQASINYNLSRRLQQQGEVFQKTRHNLNARLESEVVNDLLFLNAGGYAATLTRDTRGTFTTNPDSNNGNVQQTYSFFVEPQVRHRFGELDVSANYRYAMTVPDGDRKSLSVGEIGFDPGDLFIQGMSESTTHNGTLAVSNAPRAGRFKWTLSGTGEREDVQRLDQMYRTYTGLFDVEYALNRKISLLGSVGYEDILNTQDNFLADPVTGDPILAADGSLQFDPLRPRVTAYAQDGVIWDVGVRLSPSSRLELTARGGRRYGGTTASFDMNWQIRPGLTFRANFQESIDSTGRMLTRYINGTPIFSSVVNNQYTIGPAGCLYGAVPGTSSCFGGLTQSVTSATFRDNSANATLELSRNRWRAMVSGFYNVRRYVDGRQLQANGQPSVAANVRGADDKTLGLILGFDYRLSARATVDATLQFYDQKFALRNTGQDSQYYATSLGYSVKFGRSLNGFVRGFLSKRDFSSAGQAGTEKTMTLGVRYSF